MLQQSHDGDYEYGIGSGLRHQRPCRACNDFKTWIQTNQHQQVKHQQKTDDNNSNATLRSDCPLDKNELGHNTWSVLHTISMYYPEKPTNDEQELMKNFIKGLARFYPCETCAKDFQQEIHNDPPQTENRHSLSLWWCRQHNRVNKKLGKPEFDCRLLEQRWLDGWNDGSCD